MPGIKCPGFTFVDITFSPGNMKFHQFSSYINNKLSIVGHSTVRLCNLGIHFLVSCQYFLLVVVLSARLRFAASGYPFSIFKLLSLIMTITEFLMSVT